MSKINYEPEKTNGFKECIVCGYTSDEEKNFVGNTCVMCMADMD